MERRLATATPARIEDIHRWIHDGRRFDNLLGEQFESLRVAIRDQTLLAGAERPFTPEDDLSWILDGRIGQALVQAQLQGHPAFVLTAAPLSRVEIPTLFAARDAEIVRLIEKPPELRPGGFDLDPGASPRIVRGELRRAVTPGYKVLDLWRDGVLVFAVSGGEDFLSWGKHTPDHGPLRINQLVLMEATYLFIELARQVIRYCDPEPARVTISLGFRNMTVGDTPCGLIPGPIGSASWQFGNDIHRAPAPDNTWSGTWETKDLEPSVVGMDMVKRVYAWFGIEENRIPYTEEVGGQRVISRKTLEQIANR
jgi:hypothetical protein